jgi:TolA-binding protein
MKNVISFLVLVCGLFVLSGCVQDQYLIEKQYWQIRKQAESIFKNPAGSPPNELERAVSQLNKFIQKYPKNVLAIQAEFNISSLYIVKEEYDKAREQLNSIIKKYEFPETRAQAAFLIGNSYQMQNNWEQALEQYKKIIAEYPLTIRGIEIPVYIAQYYKSKFQPDKMLNAFQEAIAHYNSLVDKYPYSPLAFKSYTLISSCYGAMKNWPEAVSTLKTLVEKFQGKVDVDSVLMDIALIYRRELKDNVKAKETLERLIKEYPKSRLVKTAKTLLERP